MSYNTHTHIPGQGKGAGVHLQLEIADLLPLSAFLKIRGQNLPAAYPRPWEELHLFLLGLYGEYFLPPYTRPPYMLPKTAAGYQLPEAGTGLSTTTTGCLLAVLRFS
jgi:hypothetical protein